MPHVWGQECRSGRCQVLRDQAGLARWERQVRPRSGSPEGASPSPPSWRTGMASQPTHQRLTPITEGGEKMNNIHETWINLQIYSFQVKKFSWKKKEPSNNLWSQAQNVHKSIYFFAISYVYTKPNFFFKIFSKFDLVIQINKQPWEKKICFQKERILLC